MAPMVCMAKPGSDGGRPLLSVQRVVAAAHDMEQPALGGFGFELELELGGAFALSSDTPDSTRREG